MESYKPEMSGGSDPKGLGLQRPPENGFCKRGNAVARLRYEWANNMSPKNESDRVSLRE